MIGPEAARHRAHAGERLVERNGGRRRDAEQGGRLGGDVGALCRQVVGEVQDAGRPGRTFLAHGGEHGARNIVAMDAPEGVARLDHPSGAALAQIVQHRTTRPVDARQPENIDRAGSCEPGPGGLGCHPTTAPLRVGGHRRRLVDPAAVAVAVDPRRREIADPAQLRRLRDGTSIGAQHRIAVLVRRHAGKQVRRFPQVRASVREAQDIRPPIGRATRADHREATGARHRRDRLRAVAQAEDQQMRDTHGGPSCCTMPVVWRRGFHGIQ